MPYEKLMKAVMDVEKVTRSYRDAMEAVSRAARPMALQRIDKNSGIRHMLKTLDHHQAVVRGTWGPIEDLRRARLFEFDLRWQREMERIKQTMTDFEVRFRLPEVTEAARLIAEFQGSPASEALKRFAEEGSSLRRAMEGMRTPWLDMQEPMRSVGGFAALQGIGNALKNMPTFGHDLTCALRVDLGDWRDRITWPSVVVADLRARSDFYVGLGFNPALTDFPAPAFKESLDIAGLRHEPPSLIDLYGPPIPASNDDEEKKGLARTNIAHKWLLGLETQMRRFIDEQMTKAFGPDWAKHRLPKGLYDQWREKKRKAQESGGREWALIAFADFTDYELVICKRDNWRDVFAPFFGRPDSVRESFQRLYPIRVDTMHARPITQDDELLLYVETRRLVKVMIRRKP